MKEKIRNFLKKRNIIDYIIITLIVLTISIPLISKKLDVYFDDGIQHISRAYGTLIGIKNGNFNVIPSFANNFGYSWNLFYGPLTTYGILILYLLVNNFIISYKIFLLIALLLSGFLMYKLMYQMSENRNIALLSSAIYILAPYHLTDLYIRQAIGEFVSFVFIPLVFLGLYNLFNTEDKNYYFSIGAIGLILTHNLSALITAIFAIIYVLINIKQFKNKSVLIDFIINCLAIVVITSFFWIPMLQTKYMANYSVYEKGFMSSPEFANNNGLEIKNLFVTFEKDIRVYEIGPSLILLMFSIVTLRNLEKNRKEYILFLIFGIISIFMSTKYFPWKYLPYCFSIIQFPWRMLEFATFFLSIVCSINAYIIIKNFNFKDTLIIIFILLIYTFALKSFLIYSKENVQDITNYELGVVTGRENEVIAGIAKGEYLPEKINKNRFYLASRENNVEALSGKTIITDENKTYSKMNFKIQNKEETVYELPYIYYPGYLVTIDGIKIENFETKNGFLGFKLADQVEATVEVQYKGTKLMNMSIITSIFGLVVYGVYIWKKR